MAEPGPAPTLHVEQLRLRVPPTSAPERLGLEVARALADCVAGHAGHVDDPGHLDHVGARVLAGGAGAPDPAQLAAAALRAVLAVTSEADGGDRR